MTMTTQECILTKILDCASMDLSLLEDINYDLDDIIDELMANDDLSLHGILREVFRTGVGELQEEFDIQKEDIREAIEEALEEIGNNADNEEAAETGSAECEKYKELIDDLELLESGELNPKEDLDYFLNYLDTHVSMTHIDFYKRWMGYAVDEIEYKMGWHFEE